MDRNTWIGLGAAALCLLFVYISQPAKTQPPTDPLLETTMRIHDDAMRDMGEMNRLSRQLKAELPALDSLSPRADSIRTAVRQMKQAEADMFTWMREYQAPELPLDAAGRAYLEDQKTKISKNYADIRAAAETGRRLAGQ